MMAPCIIKHDAEAGGGLLVSNKKRKYSPSLIVWDRNNKVCKLSSFNGISSRKQSTNSFLSTGSFSVSTGNVSGVCGKEGEKYGRHKKVEYEDCAELHNIRSFRDDLEDGEIVDSPTADLEDGEIVDSPGPVVPLQTSVNMLQACRSVHEFKNLGKLGEGAYGVVYGTRNKKTGEMVVLKQVKMDIHCQEGFPLTYLREISILSYSDHPSIIKLKEVVEDSSTDCVFLVLEYMNYDLEALISRIMKQPFCQSEVKCLMLQLLQGVKYLHDNLVLHRDLKTSNLLLNRRGELKICDLGMARRYGSPAKPYTQLVVTIWYRAPELLLGAKQYSTEVDMWSVGCIMAELLLNQPLFTGYTGYTEIEQIERIFRMLGTPNETSWPGFSKLPGAQARFVRQPYNLLRNKFPAASFAPASVVTGAEPLSHTGFDLLDKLLTCNPAKRITADEALNHQWFHEFPLPKSKDCMPTF